MTDVNLNERGTCLSLHPEHIGTCKGGLCQYNKYKDDLISFCVQKLALDIPSRDLGGTSDDDDIRKFVMWIAEDLYYKSPEIKEWRFDDNVKTLKMKIKKTSDPAKYVFVENGFSTIRAVAFGSN